MRNMVWVVMAACAEVGWIAGINAADNLVEWIATGICVVASFSLALLAARTMAATTVYILFVGLGTAGTALLDRVVFGMTLEPAALGWLALLLAAIGGLKLTATPITSQVSS